MKANTIYETIKEGTVTGWVGCERKTQAVKIVKCTAPRKMGGYKTTYQIWRQFEGGSFIRAITNGKSPEQLLQFAIQSGDFYLFPYEQPAE